MGEAWDMDPIAAKTIVASVAERVKERILFFLCKEEESNENWKGRSKGKEIGILEKRMSESDARVYIPCHVFFWFLFYENVQTDESIHALASYFYLTAACWVVVNVLALSLN